MIEILVALSIVVVLASVVTPNLIGMLDRARVDRAVTSLENMGSAIERFEADVNRFPSRLTQLVDPVTAQESSSCGSSYPPGLANRWSGPYLNRVVPESGVPIAVGMVAPAIEQVDNGSGSTLRLTITAVSWEDAIELDLRVDGDGNPAAGALRYSDPDERGIVAAYYHLPARRC